MTKPLKHVVNDQITGSKNRYDKVSINKKNYYAYVKNSPSKLCNNYGYASHITRACNRETSTMKNIIEENGNVYGTPIILRPLNVCDNIDCMPYKINLLSTCFNLPMISNEKCSYMLFVKTVKEKEINMFSLFNVRKDKSPQKVRQNLCKRLIG